MAAKDFNDDKKDVGELGAAHGDGAYEAFADPKRPSRVDPLKHQSKTISKAVSSSPEMLAKQRHKAPTGKKSTCDLLHRPPATAKTSNAPAFCRVAEFGMLLRKSEHRGNASFEGISWGRRRLSDRQRGYRAAFMQLPEARPSP